MSGHNHPHGQHCGCSCEHTEEDETQDRGNLYSLYSKIDIYKVQCLNEAVDESGRLVFKAWHERTDRSKFVESDVDQELLFNIPFTGCIRLKGMIVIGGEEGQHPKSVKLFKNRPSMTFDDGLGEADQEFELVKDYDGSAEYEIRATRFSSISHLSIYFPTNFGAETTKIYYIGLKGDFTEFRRQEITLATYEARANPADHHKINHLDDVPKAIR
ncbi:hypothetical protein HELRODRAFT_108687 [Helobdella robusta]|uniref:PITH domain-containing protein n=1 Tax=Helobdella robusta TaxID=6412 RepID=T1EEL5_HELRO|nr:hypothetical protein HELRODRAFT_108687 [Helobdella robusta]ESN90624.1 hypothetical protein HELRODRAFT_108687 [Helobdella robusta]